MLTYIILDYSIYVQGRYGEADLLYVRAIAIGERTLGVNHPDVATGLADRAGLLMAQVRVAMCRWNLVHLQLVEHREEAIYCLPRERPPAYRVLQDYLAM